LVRRQLVVALDFVMTAAVTLQALSRLIATHHHFTPEEISEIHELSRQILGDAVG
jgi:hypothetical protein